MDSAAKVARGVAALYLANILTFLLNTLFLVLLTNFSAAALVGQFSLLNVFVVSAATLAVLALPMTGAGASATPPAVTRFLAGTEEPGEASPRRILAISASVCGLVSLLILTATALQGGASVLWAGADAVAFSFVQLGGYSLLGAHRPTLAGKVMISSGLLRYFLAALFLLGNFGLPGVFFGFALGDGVVAVYANLEASRQVVSTKATVGSLRPVFGYMASVFVAALVGLGVTQTDKLLAFFQQGFANLALYNVATVGAALAAFAPAAATNVLVPALSSFGTDSVKVRETMNNYTRYVSHISLPIGFGLAAISPALLRIFGDYYVSASPLLALVAVAVALTAMGSVYTSSLLAYGRALQYTVSSVLGLAALLVVALGTVPYLGLLGIALGRASMLFVMLGAQAYFVHRSGRFVLDVRAYVNSLAASAAMAVFVYGVMTGVSVLLPLSRAGTVAASLGVFAFGLVLYLVMMKNLGGFNESDIDFIEALLPKRLAWVGELARKFL
ncbi:MAG: oligosaccharide flippase family protein [Thaumarchaeota archaeon]|nr:oligosaccharide flippase family protein [Nitrososphaerota archaeon]